MLGVREETFTEGVRVMEVLAFIIIGILAGYGAGSMPKNPTYEKIDHCTATLVEKENKVVFKCHGRNR